MYTLEGISIAAALLLVDAVIAEAAHRMVYRRNEQKDRIRTERIFRPHAHIATDDPIQESEYVYVSNDPIAEGHASKSAKLVFRFGLMPITAFGFWWFLT